jgi:hypothetical protein
MHSKTALVRGIEILQIVSLAFLAGCGADTEEQNEFQKAS